MVKFPYYSAIVPGSQVISVDFATTPQVGNGSHNFEFRWASEWGYHAGGFPDLLQNGMFNSASSGQTWVGGPAMIARYQNWIATSEPGGALLLNGHEALGVYSYKQFNMTMTLTWNRAPTVSQIGPADQALIGTDHPITYPMVGLSATGSDPDGAPLQYWFSVSGPGFSWSSPQWSSSPSVMVPMPNHNEAVYSWSVSVSDGLSVTTSSTRVFAVVRGAQPPGGQPWLVADASPVVGGFGSWSPFGTPLQWRYQLCEVGQPCQPWTAWLPQSGSSGNVSLGSVNFAAAGWSMQMDRSYTLQAQTSESPPAIRPFSAPLSIARVSGVPVVSNSQVYSGAQGSVGQIDTLRPTFTSPATVGSVTYNEFYFCVYDLASPPVAPHAPSTTSCPVLASGWQSSPTFTAPQNALAWNKEYGVYTWARGGPTGTAASGPVSRYTTRVAIENRLRSVSLDPSTGVDAATGNFVVERSDVEAASPSGLLGVHRTYNSQSTAVGAFGRGWSSLLDQRAVWDPARPGLWLHMADGSREFHGYSTTAGFSKPFGSAVDVANTGLPGGISFRVTDANETVFDYNSAGALVSVTDRDGHALLLGTRNPTTFQQVITDQQSGRSLTLVWSGSGAADRVVSVSTQPVSGQTLTWRYGYTGDLLTQVSDPRNNTLDTGMCEKYGYSSNRMTTLTKVGRTSPSITIGYASGRVVSRSDAAGNTFSYSQPAPVTVTTPTAQVVTLNEVVITDPRQHATRERFDLANRLVNRVDRALQRRWWEFNSEGLLSKFTDESGATESFLYDTDGNMTFKTDAAGFVWSYTWDSTHRKLSATTPLGHVTTYVYDPNPANAWVEEIAPSTPDQPGVAARTTRTERTAGTEPAYGGSGNMPRGLLRRTIDPAGRVTWYDYDAKGDLRRVTDPAGKVTEYVYDELGRETSRTETWLDGDGVTTTATWLTGWTVLSQKASETEPAVLNTAASPQVTHRRKTEWQYDDRGNVTRVRELDLIGGGATRDTVFDFDLVDREWRTIAPDGGITVREFDANSNVRKVTDPLGREYVTEYDTRNLPTEVELVNYRNPLTPAALPVTKPVRSVTYTARGQVDVETDALGRQVKHHYDALGREYQTELVSFQRLDGSTISPFVLHYRRFDRDGRVDREQTGNGMAQVDRGFDARNRIETETMLNTESTDRRIRYRYDPNGNVTSRTVECVTACALTTLEERTVFDSAGRPVQQIVENGAVDLVTVTRYDQAGNPVAVTDPRGTANPASPLAAFTVVTRYDVLGRVRQTVAPSVAIDVKGAASTTGTPTSSVGYNAFGETTHVVDANGNRTVTGYDTSGRQVLITHPSYTPPGGVAIVPTESFGYDLAGNLTSRVDRLGQTWIFAFDSFNQAVRQTAPKATTTSANPITTSAFDDVGNLQSTTDPTGAVVSYTYDRLNRQRTMTQVVRPYGSVTTTSSFTTTFDYDALGNLIYTRNPQGAITTQLYSPAGELLRQTLPGSGVGVARTTFTYDLAGRVITTTDPMNRRVVTNYDTAGRIASTTASSAGS